MPYKPFFSFAQCFGDRVTEEDNNEADVLSTARFDETGDYLATGDKGGRVVVFQRSDSGKNRHSRKRPHSAVAPAGELLETTRDFGGAGGMGGATGRRGEPVGVKGPSGAEYSFFAEFQSHSPEFDCLKSAEIEEKINKIAWCKRQTESLLLLTTNDRSIKLWKVHERSQRSASFKNVEVGRYGGHPPVTSLRIPPTVVGESSVHVSSLRSFSSTAHTYAINSLSTCSDAATFLSADDLRVNLWSLEDPRVSYNIVDLKPQTSEDLTELINSAKFHPRHCNHFAYATSKGALRLGDTRVGATCDRHTKSYEGGGGGASSAAGAAAGSISSPASPATPSALAAPGGAPRSYLGEIVSSLTGFEFSGDGRYVVGRDFLTVKVWDLAMESRPVRVIPVQEKLRPYLMALYDNECIFEKFQVACSYDGKRVMTGGFGTQFTSYDVETGGETVADLQRNGNGMVAAPLGVPMPPEPPASAGVVDDEACSAEIPPWLDKDLRKKVLHFSWHPYEECVAVAGRSSLFIFNGC